ncbi:MAG: hypothetical protein ACYCSO_01155 [Cuniculiplasma sp.]
MGKPDTQIDQETFNYLINNKYIESFTKDQYLALSNEVAEIEQISKNMAEERAAFQKAKNLEESYSNKIHSIRFHLEGKEKKTEEKDQFQKEIDEVNEIFKAEKTYEEQFNQLMAKKSQLSGMVPLDQVYVKITDEGKQIIHDLSLRLYRFSDEEFSNYQTEMNATIGELTNIVVSAKGYFNYLEGIVSDIEQKSTLFSTAIGLAKFKDSVESVETRFRNAYEEMGKFTKNVENRLMATEILTGSGTDISEQMRSFAEVHKEIRHKIHIPRESATAVTAITFLSRRYDGTFPLENLKTFMNITPSYESAAVMASINKPLEDTQAKFVAMKRIFSAWGYDTSEDLELSSAYVAISDLQPEEIKDKLSVIIDAIKNCLEYPLVSSTIIATVPVMEANETLDLLSKAYNIIENNVSGFEKSEIMAASVSLVHGIKKELITDVDSKAPVVNTPYNFHYMPSPFFFPFYMPMLMVQGSYFSTFSGIGGVHPAHIHSVGGFSG